METKAAILKAAFIPSMSINKDDPSLDGRFVQNIQSVIRLQFFCRNDFAVSNNRRLSDIHPVDPSGFLPRHLLPLTDIADIDVVRIDVIGSSLPTETIGAAVYCQRLSSIKCNATILPSFT